MQISVYAEHNGADFDFSAEMRPDGSMTFTVDGKPIVATPNGIYELGFMMRRVGSFCKQYADGEFMQEFEAEWFTGKKARPEG